MQVGSLQQTMNAISGILSSPATLSMVSPPSFDKPSIAPTDELEALASFDPLLADLRVEYRTARTQRLKSEKDFGKDSPMSEIARDLEDSSWCAMQTRYIELQSNRVLRKKAQTLLSEQERKEKARARKEEQETWIRFLTIWHLFCSRLRETQSKEANDVLLLLLSLLFSRGSQGGIPTTGYRLNQVSA